jgi:hypothetical protein
MTICGLQTTLTKNAMISERVARQTADVTMVLMRIISATC